MKTSNLSADNLKKILHLDGSIPEATIRSGDIGQRIPCSDSGQLIKTLISLRPLLLQLLQLLQFELLLWQNVAMQFLAPDSHKRDNLPYRHMPEAGHLTRRSTCCSTGRSTCFPTGRSPRRSTTLSLPSNRPLEFWFSYFVKNGLGVLS